MYKCRLSILLAMIHHISGFTQYKICMMYALEIDFNETCTLNANTYEKSDKMLIYIMQWDVMMNVMN